MNKMFLFLNLLWNKSGSESSGSVWFDFSGFLDGGDAFILKRKSSK